VVIWNRRNWIGAAAIVPWIGSSLLEEKSAIGLEPLEDSEPLAWTHAKILTAAGSVINDGTLVVQKGTILAVGPSNTTAIPAGAKVIDATGKWIMPGLVCTHSHIGGVGAADGSSPIQPGVRILDSINVKDAGFKRALAGGLTTLNIMPGSGHLISGQTVYCKLRFAGKGPYIKAREYHAKRQSADGDQEKMPPRDLHLESLIEAMQGTRIVHHHTHRHDDIITVLRLSQEFGFRVVLHHVSEGWKVAKEIAEAKVPCSVIVVDSPGGKLEARDMTFKNGHVLDQAGVRVAFHTDDWITDSRVFSRSAALAVRAGMNRDRAIEALTVAGAEMLGLESRIGSLVAGKDADFCILSGDPLSVYTRVLETWVEGQKAFDLANPDDALYAEGGQGAGFELNPYLCCFGQAWQQKGAK